MRLRSPLTGRELARTGHALSAGDERWPVVDEIAFLHAGRRALADAVLDCLDCGDTEAALVLLLADQDDWARTPPPDVAHRQEAIRRRDVLSFREAMALLAFGPVATYFTHRWSDPTFLSGLALAQAHWSEGCRILEVACGAGHFLRAFALSAGSVTGGDVVFAKLWLARHFVAPHAHLVCFDAASPWPLHDGAADMLFCHDAFYFLPRKDAVAAEMMRISPRVLAGHMHNALTDNLSAGAPLSPGQYASLFPACRLFDDRELTDALVGDRVPRAVSAEALQDAAAISLAWRAGPPGKASGALTDARPGQALRRNPLYQGGQIVWPSARYEAEYRALVTYPPSTDAPERARAGEDDATDHLARLRVLLDLPARW